MSRADIESASVPSVFRTPAAPHVHSLSTMFTASFATIAEYFRLGLQVGMLSPDQVVAWVYAKIAETEVAPEELIELAWAKGLASTMDALKAVPGERNKQLAGRWLLGVLGQSLPESDEGLQLTAQRAMQIARDAELGEETYYRFDLIDDELSLARTRVYGTVEECRSALTAELAEYQPPTVGDQAWCLTSKDRSREAAI